MGLFDIFKKNKGKNKIYSMKDIEIYEEKVDSIKWGENITLSCDKKEQLDYAKKCLSYFESIPKQVEQRLCKYLFRYFRDYLQYFEEDETEEWKSITEKNILDYIQIKLLIVDSECRTDIIEFHIEGNCDWEPEHGLEITISNGKILYVGPFEDYGPNSSRLKYALENYGYYNEDADVKMNYVDKE